jgi:hypothetical protein
MSTVAGLPVVPTGDLDTLLAAVSARRMAATVARLASDEFTGRRVGTAGGAAARAWLGSQLTGIGATPIPDPFAVRAVPCRTSTGPRPSTGDSKPLNSAVTSQSTWPLPTCRHLDAVHSASQASTIPSTGGWRSRQA